MSHTCTFKSCIQILSPVPVIKERNIFVIMKVTVLGDPDISATFQSEARFYPIILFLLVKSELE